MPLAVTCPHCNRRVNAPESLAGRRVKCPKCNQPISVPAPQPTGDRDVGVVPEDATATPDDRVAAIERENARLRSEVARMSWEFGRMRRAGIVAAVLLSVACVAPWFARSSPDRPPSPLAREEQATLPGEVVARRIVLIDEAGEPRAILGMGGKGQPELRFRSGGRDRAAFGLWGPGSGHLTFYSERGLSRLNLNASDGGVSIGLADPKQDEPRIRLSAIEGVSYMAIDGADLRPGMQFAVSHRGVPEISIFDAETHRITRLLGKDGRPLFPVSQE